MTRRPSSTARGLGVQHRRARARVLARDGYICHWCGGPATEADHLLERVHGGTSTEDNMVASCKSCNASRGGRIGRRRQLDAGGHPFFLSAGPGTARRSILPPRPLS